MRWRVVCALSRGDADLLPDQRVQQRATCRRWAGRRWRPGRSAVRPAAVGVGRRRCGVIAAQERSGPPGWSLGLQRVEHAARRFLLGGAARAAFARARPGRAPAPRTRPRRSAHAPGRGWRRCGRPAPAAARLQPFLQLGLGVLAPAVDLGGGDDLAEQALHQRLRRRRSRRRGRWRRSAPRARRPGSTARCAPPPRASPSRQAQHLGQAERAAPTRCRLSSRTRWARTRVRSPSSEPAKRSNSRLETARLSTASPRNSSRSLWSAPKLRCVSARVSSAGCGEAVAEALLQGVEAGVHASDGCRARLLRAALVLDQQEDRADELDFLVVGEARSRPCRFPW